MQDLEVGLEPDLLEDVRDVVRGLQRAGWQAFVTSQDVDGSSGRAGLLDQRLRSVGVGGRPDDVVGFEGEGTVRLVALVVRRQDLAGRALDRRAAEQVDEVSAVERITDGSTHALVVERRLQGVEADERVKGAAR